MLIPVAGDDEPMVDHRVEDLVVIYRILRFPRYNKAGK